MQLCSGALKTDEKEKEKVETDEKAQFGSTQKRASSMESMIHFEVAILLNARRLMASRRSLICK